MIEPAIQHPLNALVPPERASAYVAAGWTETNAKASDGHGDTRVYLRRERDDEPVIPASEAGR